MCKQRCGPFKNIPTKRRTSIFSTPTTSRNSDRKSLVIPRIGDSVHQQLLVSQQLASVEPNPAIFGKYDAELQYISSATPASSSRKPNSAQLENSVEKIRLEPTEFSNSYAPAAFNGCLCSKQYASTAFNGCFCSKLYKSKGKFDPRAFHTPSKSLTFRGLHSRTVQPIGQKEVCRTTKSTVCRCRPSVKSVVEKVLWIRQQTHFRTKFS